VVRAVFV
jgi:hypothetical protein